MARCEKCLMDPCLCHLDGFGQEEDETTQKKEMDELKDRSCIVKVTDVGEAVCHKIIKKYQTGDRASDVNGKIQEFRVIVDPTDNDKHQEELIDLGISSDENSLPPGVRPLPIFFIKYDEPVYGLEGHWYIDEEIIYI